MKLATTKLKYKDNMNIIHSQVDRYRKEGYPENNGLARTTVVFRRHNEDDVIVNSEGWWTEMKYGSRRDQISFNYVAWKHDLKFNYIQEDIDDNEYFHCNWGWGGYDNGYFLLSTLGGFIHSQAALINIEPQSLDVPNILITSINYLIWGDV